MTAALKCVMDRLSSNIAIVVVGCTSESAHQKVRSYPRSVGTGSTFTQLPLAGRPAVHGEHHAGGGLPVVRREKHRRPSQVIHLSHALHVRHAVRTIATHDNGDIVLQPFSHTVNPCIECTRDAGTARVFQHESSWRAVFARPAL